ncbi:MAG: aspartate--tRNA(Asn) ligase [Candidatus Micrarchaeia archaeon]
MLRDTYIKDITDDPSKEIKLGGWISRMKELKTARFIWLSDRTGTVQVTLIKGNADPSLFELFDSLNIHDFIVVRGSVPEKAVAKSNKEIIPKQIQIIGKSEKPLPIDMSGTFESELETRLDWRPIALRNPKRMAVLKIESSIIEGFQKYLNSNDFVFIFTPSIIGVASEGGAEVFSIAYYDKKTYLRQDPQLHRQLLMLAGLDKIYEIGPSWRAELSHTTRHMTEHRTCAAELSFIESEQDVMRVEEHMVEAALKNVIDKNSEDLEQLGVQAKVPKLPIPEFKFPEVYEILESFGKKLQHGESVDHESELLLAKYAEEKYHSEFYFLNRFPFASKPFYVMRFDEEPEYARSFDLIYKGVELSSGGQREHRYEKIIEQVKEKKMTLDSISWFTKFFRYGAPSHGGFSLGIERITKQMLNMENIFEAAAFPRTAERVTP